MQFPKVEKFKYLIYSDRKVLAYCEDYFPICSLHRKTHRNAMPSQYADGLRNILRSVKVMYHVSSRCGPLPRELSCALKSSRTPYEQIPAYRPQDFRWARSLAASIPASAQT